MTAPKAKSISTGKVVSLLLIVALATAVTVLVIQNIGLKSDVAEGLETEESLTTEIENVEQQLKEFEFAMQSKDLEVEEKEKMLQTKEALLVEQEKKIANLLARNRISQQEAEKLRGKVESLEYYVTRYQGQIAELKEELAERDAQIAALTEDLGTMANRTDSITDIIIDQDIKIKASAKLKAHSFEFFRKKQSGAEVAETSFRASQMDDIKICMTVEENNTTKKGGKDVYIRITDPKGKLVTDESVSGFFKYDGDDMQYTTKTKMNYDGERIKICLDFKQPKGYDYEDGSHKVLAYCEKYIIGKAEFEVK